MNPSKKVVLLEASLAVQIERYAGAVVDGDPLWTARMNVSHPKEVVLVYKDFLNAGSEIIFANTYQATTDGYKKYLKVSAEEAFDMIKDTVKICKRTLAEYQTTNPRQVKLGAYIGPYGAYLHDASEYTGSYAKTISRETLETHHRPKIQACIEGGIDVLGIVTIPCLFEAEVLADLMTNEFKDTKFYMTFQCKDGKHLASGELFSDAVTSVFHRALPENLLGLGINCIRPRYVTDLLRSVKQSEIPLIVLPNKGQFYDVEQGWHGDTEVVSWKEKVPEWYELGARYFGGCCGNDVSTIAELKVILDELNQQ